MQLISARCVIDPRFTGDEEVPVYLQLRHSDTIQNITDYVTGRQVLFFAARDWRASDIYCELNCELPVLELNGHDQVLVSFNIEGWEAEFVVEVYRAHGVVSGVRIIDSRNVPTLDQSLMNRAEYQAFDYFRSRSRNFIS